MFLCFYVCCFIKWEVEDNSLPFSEVNGNFAVHFGGARIIEWLELEGALKII